MRILLNWIVNAAILYFGATQFNLLTIDSFTTALIVSLVAAIITWLIRLATKPLKVLGCLTFGVSYIAGVVLALVAIPLAFYITQDLVAGFSVITIEKTLIISLIISLVNNLIFSGDTKK